MGILTPQFFGTQVAETQKIGNPYNQERFGAYFNQVKLTYDLLVKASVVRDSTRTVEGYASDAALSNAVLSSTNIPINTPAMYGQIWDGSSWSLIDQAGDNVPDQLATRYTTYDSDGVVKGADIVAMPVISMTTTGVIVDSTVECNNAEYVLESTIPFVADTIYRVTYEGKGTGSTKEISGGAYSAITSLPIILTITATTQDQVEFLSNGDSVLTAIMVEAVTPEYVTTIIPNVAVAGDSIADTPIPYMADILPCVTSDHSLGGTKWDWQLSTGVPNAIASGFQDIIIHCGINDYAAGRTWAQVEADLDGIAALITTQRLYIDEILPYTNGSDLDNSNLRTWNANYATWCAANNATLIQSHDLMGIIRVSTGEYDDLIPTMDFDGLHINAYGDSRLGRIWADAVLAKLGGQITTGTLPNLRGLSVGKSGKNSSTANDIATTPTPDVLTTESGFIDMAVTPTATGVISYTFCTGGDTNNLFGFLHLTNRCYLINIVGGVAKGSLAEVYYVATDGVPYRLQVYWNTTEFGYRIADYSTDITLNDYNITPNTDPVQIGATINWGSKLDSSLIHEGLFADDIFPVAADSVLGINQSIISLKDSTVSRASTRDVVSYVNPDDTSLLTVPANLPAMKGYRLATVSTEGAALSANLYPNGSFDSDITGIASYQGSFIYWHSTEQSLNVTSQGSFCGFRADGILAGRTGTKVAISMDIRPSHIQTWLYWNGGGWTAFPVQPTTVSEYQTVTFDVDITGDDFIVYHAGSAFGRYHRFDNLSFKEVTPAWRTKDINGVVLPVEGLDVGITGENSSTADDIVTILTPGILSTDQLGARVVVNPTATGQTAHIISFYTDATHFIDLRVTPTAVIAEYSDGGTTDLASFAYTHVAGTEFIADLYVDKDLNQIGVRVAEPIDIIFTEFVTGTYGGVTALPETISVGSKNGASIFKAVNGPIFTFYSRGVVAGFFNIAERVTFGGDTVTFGGDIVSW